MPLFSFAGRGIHGLPDSYKAAEACFDQLRFSRA